MPVILSSTSIQHPDEDMELGFKQLNCVSTHLTLTLPLRRRKSLATNSIQNLETCKTFFKFGSGNFVLLVLGSKTSGWVQAGSQ